MEIKEIPVRLNSALNFFVLSLIVIFYFLESFYLFLPLIILLWIKNRKITALFLFFGFMAGLFFHINFLLEDQSAGLGLHKDRIDNITVELIEDSFLSSKGKSIYKGQLISVSSGKTVHCSSTGVTLIIGSDTKQQYYWGEVISFDGSIDEMTDSREFPFISFVKGDIFAISWKSPLFQLRKSVKMKIERHMGIFSEDVSSLFNALFTGNDENLTNDIKDLFRRSGVPHLLALSGFHVAIIVLVLTYLLKQIFGRISAILISFPFLLAYLFLTGPSPSLLRAVLMYFISGISLVFQKEISIIQVLLLTCIGQLIISPVQGFSLSFQLSYLALVGILILGKKIFFRLQQWLPTFLSIPLSASLGAHILTAPLLIFVFGELYPIGLISSLVLTPFITLFMWSTLIIYLLSFIKVFEVFVDECNFFLDRLFQLTIDTALWFSKTPALRFSSFSDIIFYLSMISIIVLSLYIDIWRINGRRTNSEFKLRFTIGNTVIAGNHGIGPKKKMEPEFPD